MGDTSVAIEAANAALSIDPSYAEAHLLLGVILEARGMTAEAGSHYRIYLAHDSLSVKATEAERRLALLGNKPQSD
jgi:Tfp pilus assembly protein PilF